MGFVVPALWPLALVGFLPFLFITTKRPVGLSTQAFRGFLLGLPLYGLALWAIFWHTLPIDWFGIEHPLLQILAVGTHWIFSVCVLSLGTAVFAVVLQYFLSYRYTVLVCIPSAWVVGEWLHAHVFAFVFAGNGSLLGAHFTLGHLGYVLANNALLLQLASVGGVYLLSATVILVNVLIYRVITTKNIERNIYVGVSIVVVCCVSGYGAWSLFGNITTSEETIRVAAVSTYFPPQLHFLPGEAETRIDTLATLVAPHVTAEALLLPESAAFARYARDANMVPQVPLFIDAESVRSNDGNTHARSIFVYRDGRIETSDKQFILPLGEYVPYISHGVLALVGNKAFQEQVRNTRSYVSGTHTKLAQVGSGNMAVRFCDEVMSPYLYARDVEKGASVLANVSSYSWFHGSRTVFAQMQSIAKVRAVEEGRWYVQSGNMSPAYMLDNRGMVVTETSWDLSSVVEEDVPLRTDSTPYQVFGTFFPIGALLVVFSGFFGQRVGRLDKRSVL